jgi:hypothetical protein
MGAPIALRRFNPMSMQRYVVVRGFSLGGTELSLRPGDEVMFDGKALVEVDGEEHKVPKFRGAVSAKWVVLGDQFDAGDVEEQGPVRAPMKMRSAEGGNPMDYRTDERRDVRHSSVEDDDRQVRSVSGHAQATKRWNDGRTQRRASAANMPISVDQQDARVVVEGAFKTSAKNRDNIEHGIGNALYEINQVKIDPGQGISREEMLARMSPEQQDEYMAKIEAHRSSHVDEPTPVARVRTARKVETEGFTVTNSVGGGTETIDLGGTGGTGSVETVEIEGIRITNTNGPKRDSKKAVAAPKTRLVPTPKGELAGQDVRRKIAKSMCPDFPDLYDFNAPERKKIARIQADFEDRGDVIQAIYAAEGDSMKSLLVENFPEVFA